MESIILSLKNYHRASIVAPVSHPELSYKWLWRDIANKENMMCITYKHKVVSINGSEELVVSDKDLSNWMVLEWQYEENFEYLYKESIYAYSNTSFSPEERGLRDIRNFEKALQEDLKIVPENEKEAYCGKFSMYVRSLFYKHSRIASIMITGPAKFPTKQNEKANASYMKEFEEFEKWRIKMQNSYSKAIERGKSKEEKEQEEWCKVRKEIINSQKSILAIDLKIDKCSIRSLFVNSLYGKLETIAKAGKIELIRKSLDLIKEYNSNNKYPKPLFTERHKVWKLIDVALNSISKQDDKACKQDDIISLEGVEIIKKYSINRLQIIFNEKPDSSVISKLKHEGFRWSPRYTAWQRQLTLNSLYAVSRLLPVTVEQLKSGKL